MASQAQEILIQRVVGQRLRELRRAAGLRAMELAERAGLSQGQLSKIEHGKATLSIGTLTQLCQVLGRPLSYLFQSEEEVPRVLGTLNTVVGPEYQGMRFFVEEVRRQSGGRISLALLNATQLAPASLQVEHLRQGAIDLFIEGLYVFQEHAAGVQPFSLPYGFASQPHVLAYLEGAYFRETTRPELEAAGIRLLNPVWNWWRGGEWVLVARRPIIHPEDLRGLRVRATDPAINAAFWREMGAKPVPLPWEEVKTALRLGHIDVLPTHRSHLYPLGFCRHAPFVTRLGDVNPPLAVAMNQAKHLALPPSLQDALAESCRVAGEHFTRLVRRAAPQNQRRDLAEHRAAYLRVDQGAWRREAARARRALLAQGVLDPGAQAAVERSRPGSLDGTLSWRNQLAPHNPDHRPDPGRPGLPVAVNGYPARGAEHRRLAAPGPPGRRPGGP